MAVLRTQHALKSAAATLVDGAETVIAIPRPLTLPAEDNTLDHVVRPSTRDEFRAGAAFIDLPAAFIAADVFMRELRIVKAPNPSNPPEVFDDVVSFTSGISQASLFPTGASLAGGRLIISESGNAFPTNGSELGLLLKNLSVREDESISMTLFNNSGGDLGPLQVEVHYDFGLNPGQLSLRGIK